MGLLLAARFAMNLPRTRYGSLILAILGLWYVPFGTVANVLVLTILMVFRIAPSG